MAKGAGAYGRAMVMLVASRRFYGDDDMLQGFNNSRLAPRRVLLASGSLAARPQAQQQGECSDERPDYEHDGPGRWAVEAGQRGCAGQHQACGQGQDAEQDGQAVEDDDCQRVSPRGLSGIVRGIVKMGKGVAGRRCCCPEWRPLRNSARAALVDEGTRRGLGPKGRTPFTAQVMQRSLSGARAAFHELQVGARRLGRRLKAAPLRCSRRPEPRLDGRRRRLGRG